MSNTIEAVIGRTVPAQRAATTAHLKRLTANWQHGLEAGGHVQRKLRFVFTNLATHQPAS